MWSSKETFANSVVLRIKILTAFKNDWDMMDADAGRPTRDHAHCVTNFFI